MASVSTAGGRYQQANATAGRYQLAEATTGCYRLVEHMQQRLNKPAAVPEQPSF